MGDFVPTYSTDNIWRDDNMEQCLSDDLDTIESNIAALQTGKANATHTHSEYAPTAHTHSEYAAATHTHTGYATTDHTHTGYAASTHEHDNYALATDVAALQTLVGDTAVAQQISTAIVSKADVNHTHTGYAADSHTHTMANVTGLADELAGKYEKPSTGIPKTDLASDVQTSLGKADTAIQSLAGYATESYVDTKVSNLLDSAPDTLNTLNELAAALGDDPNFATTIATQLGGKASQTALNSLAELVGDTAVATQISAAVATKADSNHTHTEYAASNHTHTEYATVSHEHTGYADADHTHTEYAASVHAHDNYALATHEHTGYAAASDVTALQTLVGDTAVSTQISNAVANKADSSHTHSAATTSAAGFMSASDKTKLDGIATGANKITVDSALSSTSTNPVQNKVIQSALAGKADADHVHNVFSSLTEIGITTFPTTMQAVSEAMPKNSMIVIDTRRVNGAATDYGTETISDWGNDANGVAIIVKGVSTARIGMFILYGTTATTSANIHYGSYAHDADNVNWINVDDKFKGKVDKVKKYSAVDLNTLTESGLYYVSDETTALHCPAGSNGHILVMSDGTRVRQVFFRVGTVDTNSWQWYSRHLGSDTTAGLDSNGWSQWWLLSGTEKVWNGGTVLNSEINIGSRYGCQSWIVVARLQNTGAMASVVIPRHFLTSDTDLYRFQIADETAFISFYIYYKSDNDVYLKVIDQTDSEYTTLKYVYRMS